MSDERWALVHAISDGVTDRLDPDIEASDEFYDWYETNVEKPVLELLCKVYGHVPMQDHCGLPEHDHCTCCGKTMPGAAHTEMAGE